MDDTQKRNLWIGGGVVFLVLVAIALFFAFRGGGEEEEAAEPTQTPVAEAVTPTLQVESPPVSYRSSESEELDELEAGETLEIEPGANVIVGPAGLAAVTWPDFLFNELLEGTDWLLSLSLPATRQAILDQATGTARYVLEGAGEPASVEVLSQWLTVLLDEGEADMIVSLVPGEEPSVWVAAVEGDAEVTRGEESVTVPSGHVAGFTEVGDAPEILAADMSRIEAWYDEVKAGTASGNIASVSFRCLVAVDEVELLSDPDDEAEPVGETLFRDATVTVAERDEEGLWVLVSPLTGSAIGWVKVDALTCNGPIDALPYSTEDGEPTPTTAAPLPRPTRPFVPVPTPTFLVTPTPTPTPTPGGEAQVSFTVDDDEIERGECTTLRWSVENVQAVYLDGEGVTGQGERKVCPESTTTYTLEVRLLDGSTQSYGKTVEVEDPEPDATDTPPPAATDVPPTQAPPTQEPPTQEPPTQEPPTQEPPTEVPPTSAPTAAPPTSEPPTSEP